MWCVVGQCDGHSSCHPVTTTGEQWQREDRVYKWNDKTGMLVNILIYANTFGCMSKNAHQAAYMALSLASYYLHIIHTSLWEMSFNYSYYLLFLICTTTAIWL